MFCLFLVSPLVVSSGEHFSPLPLFAHSFISSHVLSSGALFARLFFFCFFAFLFAAPVGPKRERPQKAAQNQEARRANKSLLVVSKRASFPLAEAAAAARRASPFVWARPRVFALCYGAWCRAGPGQAVQASRTHTHALAAASRPHSGAALLRSPLRLPGWSWRSSGAAGADARRRGDVCARGADARADPRRAFLRDAAA